MGNYSVSYSTELMRNYLQSEVLAPEAKFEALQTQAGASLLFSISTQGVLYVTKEVPGDRSGWKRSDLSSALIAHDFGGNGVACKDFAVAQSAFPPATSIHLAMVVSDGTSDHLYLSLANSDSDTSWTSHPSWTAFPFDNPDHQPSPVVIVGVLISEAADAEYIVVDVVRDPSSNVQTVSRYYIDTSKTDGYAWHYHDMAIDVEVDRYSSRLGRSQSQYVDGIYTAGHADGSPQFVYQPLYNAFNPHVPAPPARLQLPGNLVPDAIASCRKADHTSDLYATANGTLFYFDSHNQHDEATGVELLESPLLNGVRALYATLTGTEVMIWGLNGDDQVFYTTCPLAELTTPGSWKVPLPIVSGVEQVSPYLDRANSANTFFAHVGENRLIKAVKSPDTTVWTTQSITLPPLSNSPAQQFDSYTTRIQVTGPDGQAAKGMSVTLIASNVKAVYINHLYYVVGAEPVHVATDAMGSVTVVEPVDTLTGTRLSVEVDGVTTEIDPMDKPFRKAAGLDTTAELTDAVITYHDGSTKPLIPAGTDQNDLRTVAEANAKLSQAYASLPPSATAVATRAGTVDDLSGLLVDAGDLLNWLGHEIDRGVDVVIQFVKDEATDFWRLVVTIEGDVYNALLETVETIISAIQWVYHQIKIAIKDLIDFLKFVFEWKDITRTQRVVRNFVKVYLAYQLAQVQDYKSECDQMFTQLENTIDNWAGTGGWSGLGNDGKSTVDSMSTPAVGQSAPGCLLSHHYQGNADAITPSPPPPSELDSSAIAALMQALNNEGHIIGDTLEGIGGLAAGIGSMPLTDLLEKMATFVGAAALDSAKNVIDTLFDIVYELAKKALDAFQAPIHIPVVTDILNDFGVPSFSLMDVVCWMVAIPATLIYKAAKGVAPFPDNADTQALIDAPDLPSLITLFARQSADAAVTATSAGRLPATHPSGTTDFTITAPEMATLSGAVSEEVFIVGHGFAGFCALASAIVSGFEAADEQPDNPWGLPSAALGIVGGVTGGLANTLVPCDPIANTAVSDISTTVTGIRVLCKIIFCGPAQKLFKGNAVLQSITVNDGRGVGAVVDAVLTLPALTCTIWHLSELAGKPAGGNRSIAIIDETSQLTSYISRISYAFAVNDDDPDSRAAFVTSLAVANVCTGGLQMAEMFVSRTGYELVGRCDLSTRHSPIC
ncbi:hypothetical protein IFM12275_03460 [Nocardia sputorum]|uniref:hypothetical protein n=1 Tax=Nocardia sputorum TaxID=2984338 RepID=UPI002492A719|nr:hypothetical protein [Nocardia sputorum]BDT90370.1 hypothetical protein IFM12275_03460 [Nocardia sputorum]